MGISCYEKVALLALWREGIPRLDSDVRVKMGLFDFITTADTFKVKIGKRTLADEEIPLIQKTMVRVFLPSKQPFSLIRPYY
nr:hypothetical protein [Tanacetum cinerariifolium]